MRSRSTAYLAAPLFTIGERQFNAELCKHLEPFLDVYLPQRDGILLSERLALGEDRVAVSRSIYEKDLEVIRQSDYLIAIIDGPAVDDGVAFELGFAAGIGIPCVGLQTDSRRGPGYFRNPMWDQAFDHLTNSIEELESWASLASQSIRD